MNPTMPISTPCECNPPIGESFFYCPRHHCNKSDHFLTLCRTRKDFFEMWESGTGLGQSESNEVPPATIDCIHRGQTPTRQVQCELCGARQIQLPVYACAVHGECTMRRWGDADRRTTQNTKLSQLPGSTRTTRSSPRFHRPSSSICGGNVSSVNER